MAPKTHLRRRQQRKVRGNAITQPFFQKKGSEHTEVMESSSFFAPANTKVQTKLTVNQPGDAHEQEADRMAEKVVSAPATTAPGVQRAGQKEEEKVSRAPQKEEEKVSRMGKEEVQKKEEEEPKVQTKKEEEVQRAEAPKEEEVQKKEEEEKIATKSTGNAAPTVSTSTAKSIQNSKGTGSTLPEQTLHEMSNAFGYDFSKVRIHTDSQSERMNNDLQAQAFTNGKDIYFNEGKYSPETQEGKKLLAHELTHVVQQNNENLKSNVQLSRLRDFRNKVPPEPTDSETVGTNEFKAYMNPNLIWQKEEKMTKREALFACRLILKDMQKGISINWEKDARKYMNLAREQNSPDIPFFPPIFPPVFPGIPIWKVEVRAHKLNPVLSLFNKYHLFIILSPVQKDSKGAQFFFRGGANGSCTDYPESPLGSISTDSGIYKEGTVDWIDIKSNDMPRVVVATGDINFFAKVNTCLTLQAIQIENSCTKYDFLGPNSNSVVYTLLEHCSLPKEKPDVSTPGWGQLIG